MSTASEVDSAFVHPPWVSSASVCKLIALRAVPAEEMIGALQRRMNETRDRIAETHFLLLRSDALIAAFHRVLTF